MEEGLRLTAIGLGTAFALLLVIGVLISIVGRLATVMSPDTASQEPSESTKPSNTSRDKALAAVVAVTALRGKDRHGTPAGDRS